jgi:large subunit ribosomal protein L25
MVTLTINGLPRTEVGKKATKAVRVDGRIPCVLYGSGSENVHFTTTTMEVRDLIFTSEFKLAEVTVDGKSYRCIVKDVQYHPVKDTISHIDFLSLKDGKSFITEVPLKLEGIAAGVRAGGKLYQKLRTIKIKVTPESMVASINVDVSKLKLGSIMRIRDIQAIPGVDFLTNSAMPIASVSVPRGLTKEEEDAAHAAGEGAPAAE